MNVVKKDIDQLNATLTVSIEKQDYEKNVENALRDYGKKASINGFRPGKVPAGLVKKMYGKHFIVEQVTKLANQALQNFIKESNLDILGEPLPVTTDVNFDTQTDFNFSFEIGLAPKITIPNDLMKKVAYNQIKVGKEVIDGQVEQLLNRFGQFSESEAVTGEEMLQGNFVQVDAAGKEVEGGHTVQAASILLKVQKTEAVKALFKGKKQGDSVVFNPSKVLENESDVAYMLRVTKEDTAKLSADYRFTIEKVQLFKPAELNQELLDKVFGEGKLTTEEELRNELTKTVESRYTINSDYKFLLDIREAVKEYSFELPEAFLKRWLIAANEERNVSPEQIEEEFPLYMIDLRWQIIKGSIISENDIKVTHEDLMEAARRFARLQMTQMGFFNPEDDDINRWAGEIVKDREQVQKLLENEVETKLVTCLKEKLKPTVKSLSPAEFEELFK